jgi:rhodanese-related sulfurtransferase
VASRIAAELIRRGYRAAALKGGISEWVTAKLPTDAKSAPQSAPPAPGSLKG